jgi:hypothetical protein
MKSIDEMPPVGIWHYDNTSDNSYTTRFDEGYGLVIEVTGSNLKRVVERTINTSIEGNREVWLT